MHWGKARKVRKTTRVRRGKEVDIPEEWRGKVTYPQTIRKRPSKLTRKVRNATKGGYRIMIHGSKRNRIELKAPTEKEFE